MEISRQPAVVLRHLRAGAAAARVAQQREVRPWREADRVIVRP